MLNKFNGERLWEAPEEKGNIIAEGEIRHMDYEARFTDILAGKLVEALRISWDERETMKRLFISILEENIEQLLEDYLHANLEIILESFNSTLELDIKVNHNYAVHAKLSSLLEAIAKEWKKEDGSK